ncbi:MAG: autotransporter domain-containing protein [Parvibaculum sp.]
MVNRPAHPLPSSDNPRPSARRLHRAFLRLLLASTALGAPMHGTALAADILIDGGATETVNGDNSGTQPSPWSTSDYLIVGDSGTGTLNVLNGGEVSNFTGYIGDDSTGAGMVTVDGAGSSWTNSSELVVGRFGDGTLSILSGGEVSSVIGYIGASTGSTGAVTVDGAGSIWTSSIALRIGYYGTGALTIAGEGQVDVNSGAGAVSIAYSANSNGTLIIGAEAGSPANAPGTLSAATVQFGDGAGKIVFNHNSSKYRFGAAISGAGTIEIRAGHNDFTGDSSSFSGTTTLYGGSLFVNGVLGGMIEANGALGGAGTVAAANIGSGGRLAPGNSIGTLTVTGDLGFDSNSTYEVEVNDGGNVAGVNNDFASIGGMLTIGNDVAVSVLAANQTDDGSTYTPGLVYTILTADDGIAGTFAVAKTKMAFLTPELSYDANNVYLTLVTGGGGDGDGGGDVGFGDAGHSSNQRGVGDALENFGPGHPLYDQIIMMTEEEARAAFDALSGESHASSSTSQFLTAAEIRQQLLDRLAATFGTGGGFASLAGAPAAGDAAPGSTAVWGQLFGSWGKTDGKGGAASINRDVYGFIGGIDREVAPGVRAGIAAGYSRSGYDVDARASSGDGDNFHIAAYAGTALGNVGLKSLLSYSYGKVQADRTVIVGLLTNNLSADYDTHTFQAAAEAGIDLDAGPVTFTPFAGLAGIYAEREGFTETGGPAALTIAGDDNTAGLSTLGLRARREDEGFAISGSLAWRHAFGDVDPVSRAAFASAPAATFAVRGTPISENALALDAGIGTKLGRDTTLALAYAGEYASDARDHGLKAELRFEF